MPKTTTKKSDEQTLPSSSTEEEKKDRRRAQKRASAIRRWHELNKAAKAGDTQALDKKKRLAQQNRKAGRAFRERLRKAVETGNEAALTKWNIHKAQKRASGTKHYEDLKIKIKNGDTQAVQKLKDRRKQQYDSAVRRKAAKKQLEAQRLAATGISGQALTDNNNERASKEKYQGQQQGDPVSESQLPAPVTEQPLDYSFRSQKTAQETQLQSGNNFLGQIPSCSNHDQHQQYWDPATTLFPLDLSAPHKRLPPSASAENTAIADFSHPTITRKRPHSQTETAGHSSTPDTQKKIPRKS